MTQAVCNGSFPGDGVAPGSPHDAAQLDRATRQAIDAQVRAGLAIVTDGLLRRVDPVRDLAESLGGVSPGPVRRGFPGSGVAYAVPIVESEIAWKGPRLVEDFLFASRGTAATVKPLLVGPYTLARIAEDRAYDDPMALAMALAIALNQELRGLQAAGATIIQIDEPALLEHKDEFPTFTRIWEVLSRGIAATLVLHLEGGDIAGLYPGIARLKRLGCLSLDCVRGPENIGIVGTSPLPGTVALGLGMVGEGAGGAGEPAVIAERVAGAGGLPPRARIFLGTAGGLGGLSPAEASLRAAALAEAARILG